MGLNLFYGTGLAPCIVVLRSQKPKASKGQVLIINAETLMKRGRNQNTLEPEHVNLILKTYREGRNIEGLARRVALNEIAANNYNLNIPLYVAISNESVSKTFDESVVALSKITSELSDSRKLMRKELEMWGFNVKA
jgi:type I restriction enzyme M protein